MVFEYLPPASFCQDSSPSSNTNDDATILKVHKRPSFLSPVTQLLKSSVGLVNDVVFSPRDGLTEEERQEKRALEERKQILLLRMQNAASNDEWKAAAEELDRLEDNDTWKRNPESPDYDASLIAVRLQALDEARISCDVERMLYLVRTSLTRDLGGMGNINLYKYSRVGTKDLIERYIDSTVETIQALVKISEHSLSPEVSSRDILDQVVCARQAFGRSALLLSGGATFGMNHIGVMKALWEQKLLPRIISGSSAGSIVCSVVCTRTDEELPDLITSFPYGNLAVFEEEGHEESLFVHLGRLLTEGAWVDVKHLTQVMRGLLGDMTFQEAYNRTRRILNICVSSPSIYELPRLLNYVTAPNVMIWSAVAASCSIPFLFNSAPLLIKDTTTGEHLRWNPTQQYWIDGSIDNDLPITKLSEMFNVNHFIVSQVNPHIAPFLPKEDEIMTEQTTSLAASWFFKAADLAKSEALHRMNVLADIGIFPTLASKAKSILSQKYSGDITILPAIDFRELHRMIKNPSSAFLLNACLNGEKATWPKMSRIRNHCAVELALDQAVQQLRARVVFSPSQVDLRRMSTGSTLQLTRPHNHHEKTGAGGSSRPRHKRRVSGSNLHTVTSPIDDEDSDNEGFFDLSSRKWAKMGTENPFAAPKKPSNLTLPTSNPAIDPIAADIPLSPTQPHPHSHISAVPWRLRADDLSVHDSSTADEQIFSAASSDADVDTHTEASSPELGSVPRMTAFVSSNSNGKSIKNSKSSKRKMARAKAAVQDVEDELVLDAAGDVFVEGQDEARSDSPFKPGEAADFTASQRINPCFERTTGLK